MLTQSERYDVKKSRVVQENEKHIKAGGGDDLQIDVFQGMPLWVYFVATSTLKTAQLHFYFSTE